MRTLLAALLIASTSQHVKATELPLPAPAAAVVREYSEAVTRGDCPSALRLASPAMTKRLVARGETQNFCDYVVGISRAQMVEEIGVPSAIHSHGKFRMAIVPNRRFTRQPQASAVISTESAYVLHSADSGSSWHVLDLACTDERWLKEVYPPYDGDPPVPQTRLLTTPVAK